MTNVSRLLRRSFCVQRFVPLAVFALCLMLALMVAPGSAAASEDGANVTVYETGNVTITDTETIEAAIANGSFEPAGTTVIGETLVVAIESERLADTITEGDGSTTEQFFAALDGDAEFRIRQTNHGKNSVPKVMRASSENATVYRSNATTYILLDTTELRLRNLGQNEENPTPELYGGEQFTVQFGYGELTTSWSEKLQNHTFRLYWSKGEFGAVFHRYDPLPSERVTRDVDVNVAPSRSLVARLTLENNRTIRAPVERGADGWAFVLDLSGLDPGTDYVLDLVHDGEVIDRYNGTVREPHASVTNATLTQVDGQTVLNVTANLSHGGHLQVLNEACEQVGWQSVTDTAGVATRLSVEFYDSGGEELRVENPSGYGVVVRAKRDYSAAKQFYHGPTANATVNFDGGCQTPTETSVPPTTTATATTGAGSTTAAETTTTESPGQSGFGVVVSALAGAALVALLVGRTRHE